MSVTEDPPQPLTSYSEDENLVPNIDEFDTKETPVKRHLYVEEVKGMWNLAKICRQLGTREQAVAFAEEKGMIPTSRMCNYHKKPMTIIYSTNKTVGSFRCNRGPCRIKTSVSRGNGTWFENIKITLTQVFYIMYAYSTNWSYDLTIKEDFSEGTQCLSRATINDWFKYCREAVVAYQMDKQNYMDKIDDPGNIKKRKYNTAIYEYLWRRDNVRNKKDPFENLIIAVKYSFKEKKL